MTRPRRRIGSKHLSQLALTIKAARAEQGLTQKRLAELTGVSLIFIRQFEQGKRSVRLDLVEVLLDFLGLELRAEARPGLSLTK